MSNAFMASAEKSKREQASIQKAETKKSAEVELKNTNIRIPADLHRKALLHRVETGESFTKLVVRLLREELG